MHQNAYDIMRFSYQNQQPNAKDYYENLKPAKKAEIFSKSPAMNIHLMPMTQPAQQFYSTLIPKPYRGVARFRSPAPLRVSATNADNSVRTRNLSRTRGTVATEGTTTTTYRPPTTLLSPFTLRYNRHQNQNLREEINMIPKQRAPKDFQASPLFGLIMDERDDSNAFDNEKIEKIHETFRASSEAQNGFYPVIQNGTPSSIFK